MANVSSSNGIEKYPKLRFPEFTEPWNETVFDTFIQMHDEKVFGEHSYEVLTSSREGLQRQSEHFGTEQRHDTDGYNIIPLGYCTYRNRSDDGFFTFNVNNAFTTGIVSKFYPVFKFVGANSTFMTEYLNNSISNKKKLSILAVGTSQVVLSISALRSASFCIPYEKEQDKLASFIELLNIRIVKQRQLVELLKKYKRGVDASFFDIKRQHSEKELYGWDCVPFGDVVAINPKTPALPEHFIYIDLESVDFGRLQCLKHIDRKDAPSRAQRVLANSDVLFQMVRPYQKNNYFFKDIFNSPVVASTGYAQIRCLDCDPVFVFEQISSDYFSQEAMLRSTGTGYPAINSEGLAEIPFFLPPLPEQKKIGEFLSLLRTKIEYENGQLDVLNKLKTALLQQLFI